MRVPGEGGPKGALADACAVAEEETGQQKRPRFSSLPQNPSPGLFAMKHPLTYVETSIDYHLCTHPKYKFTKESHCSSSIPLTQKQFLHHMVKPSRLSGRAGSGLRGRAGDKEGGSPLEPRNRGFAATAAGRGQEPWRCGPCHAPALKGGRWGLSTIPTSPYAAPRLHVAPFSTFLVSSSLKAMPNSHLIPAATREKQSPGSHNPVG